MINIYTARLGYTEPCFGHNYLVATLREAISRHYIESNVKYSKSHLNSNHIFQYLFVDFIAYTLKPENSVQII